MLMCPVQSVLWRKGVEGHRGQTGTTTLCGRVDHNLQIRNRRQRTDIGKYSFVNRTIEHWNQLPAEVLEPFPCNSTTFRERLRKVISEVR
jgi:hypothetical protein